MSEFISTIPYLLIFVLPTLIAINQYVKNKEKIFFLMGLIFKIFCSLLMTYFLINRYEYGDFKLYFDLPIDLSKNCFWENYHSWCEEVPFTDATSVSWIFGFIFTILPASLLGLSIISGVSAFWYTYSVIKIIEHFTNDKKAMVLLMFAPTLSMQEGYIGKETLILPAIGLVVKLMTGFELNKKLYAILFFVLLAIWCLREYQAYFMVAAIIFSIILSKTKEIKSYLLLFFISIFAVSALLWFGVGSTFIEQIQNFLLITYSGGNLVMMPFDFPLNILQLFRPFPWEVHEIIAIIPSIENLVFLFFCIYGIGNLSKLLSKWKLLCREYKIILLFSFGIFMAYFFTFGFSHNIGDLQRRHVYFYPFLIIIFSKYKYLDKI